MLGLHSWPCSLLLLLVLLSASVQTVSLSAQRLQMLLSQLLPVEPESTLPEEDTKEGSGLGPQLLSSTLPFLPSGARAARPSLWRKTLASRKWALPRDWAWKAVPRGCFGLKLDRIGTFSGLGC
ncbi:C-type natriuretic peptide 2-like [Neopsephotus bourkii]|uniref:C-type natriuretic peptide 2-like n=1 Tax=Neopsephotus bourkii TaxID=309878 RepID=UPI002AA52493|nr:C-type natriuretic peptide 2-like [Neopsephotus bourkii]